MAVRDYNNNVAPSAAYATETTPGLMSPQDRKKANYNPGENLLLNSDFRINQRGQTTYNGSSTSRQYIVDRWEMYGANISTVVDNYQTDIGYNTRIKVTFKDKNVQLGQITEIPVNTADIMTVCIKVNGTRYEVQLSTKYNGKAETIGSVDIGSTGLAAFAYAFGTSISIYFQCRGTVPATYTIDYIDLFAGPVGFPHHVQDLALELEKCQRFYEVGFYTVIATSTYWMSGFQFLTRKRSIPTIHAEYLRNADIGDVSNVNNLYYNGTRDNSVNWIGSNDGTLYGYGTRSYILKATIDAEIY